MEVAKDSSFGRTKGCDTSVAEGCGRTNKKGGLMTCTNIVNGKKCGAKMVKPGDQSGSSWICYTCGAVKQS